MLLINDTALCRFCSSEVISFVDELAQYVLYYSFHFLYCRDKQNRKEMLQTLPWE